MKFFITICIIVLSFWILFISNYYTIISRSDYSHMKDNCEYYDSTYLSKSGCSEDYGSYQLKSFNGGEDWYNVVDDSITGFADTKLVKHLQAWETISKFVEIYGPINLENLYLIEFELNEVGITIDEI